MKSGKNLPLLGLLSLVGACSMQGVAGGPTPQEVESLFRADFASRNASSPPDKQSTLHSVAVERCHPWAKSTRGAYWCDLKVDLTTYVGRMQLDETLTFVRTSAGWKIEH